MLAPEPVSQSPWKICGQGCSSNVLFLVCKVAVKSRGEDTDPMSLPGREDTGGVALPVSWWMLGSGFCVPCAFYPKVDPHGTRDLSAADRVGLAPSCHGGVGCVDGEV